MDEKSAAVSCLGWLISENCEAAASFIDAGFHFLAGLSTFDLHPPVASTAIVAFTQAIKGLVYLMDDDYSWEKGKPSNLSDPAKEVSKKTKNSKKIT